MSGRWEFGAEPLEQTAAAADRLRRAVSLLLAMEQEDDAVAQLIGELDRAIAALEQRAPVGQLPRIGDWVDGDGRVYLDHARDVGAYNPVFPVYELTVVDAARAEGTVTFPVAYEGPPGLVHGGFLALVFDAVVQHHSCDVGLAGKTTSMSIRYRRPTPLLVALAITVDRRVEGDRIHSTARLLHGDELLCEAQVEAIAGVRGNLPAASPRRPA
jgi:hypothetical protein